MSDTNKPLISVIIAVYNPGKYLRPCLDSIVGQTYTNLEIILVDDGSTDDSLAICKEYAEKDSRVIVYHKENSGVSATRNQGIRLAHGDYYSFIDSDDWLEKDTYEYLLGLMLKHDVDIVTHEHFINYPNKEITNKSPEGSYGLFNRKDGMNVLVHYFPFACNKLFSKHTINNLWFNENIFRGEDGLFTRFAFDNADKVWFDKRPLYHYVQSEESAVRGKFRKSQLTAVNLIDIYDSFFLEKYPELYNHVMSTLCTLMITLYCDMKADSENYIWEEKLVVDEFRKIYKKLKLKEFTLKKKTTLRLFRFSPYLFYKLKNITA